MIARIASFPATNSNLVLKSTIKYVHSFSGTSFAINFSTSTSVQFFIFWHISHLPIYFSMSFVIPNYQYFFITNSIIFCLLLYSATNISVMRYLNLKQLKRHKNNICLSLKIVLKERMKKWDLRDFSGILFNFSETNFFFIFFLIILLIFLWWRIWHVDNYIIMSYNKLFIGLEYWRRN